MKKKLLPRSVLLLLGLFFCNLSVAQEERDISGNVKDATGMPLPAANIVVKGTQNGADTDFDGNYSLRVKTGDILVFTYIGMQSQEVPVKDNQDTYDIVMKEENAKLDEVVVIGYGTQKRADVTGAISVMKANNLDERPLLKVDQALTGQLAGVRVVQTSGIPSKGLSVQVRGTGSISANTQPLYVIDGFPLDPSAQNSAGGYSTGNPLDNISPNDIESIQVLKDAAAAAIYGSRAANGVVIIQTKSGQMGAPTISFNTYVGTVEASKKLDVLNASEWIDRATGMIDYNWINSGPGRTASQTAAERQAILGGFDASMIRDERWYQPGYGGLDYVDWQDALFKTGFVQNYQLSARGATENVKYYISGEYLDQDGYAVGVNYKRFSARANVEVKVSDKISMGVNLNPTYSEANDPGLEGKDNQLHKAATSVPLSADGLDYNIGDNTRYEWGGSSPSPLRVLQNSIGRTKTMRTLSTLYGTMEIVKNLNFKSTLNFDNTDEDHKSFTPSFVTNNNQASGTFTSFRKQNFVNENTLNYDATLGTKHRLNALVGLSYNWLNLEQQRIRSADGFASDEITTINGANNINVNDTYTLESKRVLISYFGRVQYSFDDKYLLTASIRRDGSSNFGQDTKWGIFPSASAGWDISKENFLKSASFLDQLKLRASWGISGNNGILDDYGSISMLGFANYSYNGALVTGLVPANAANPNLGWEESESFDYGIDFSVFNNRIRGSFDYYIKTNTDLLLNIPVPTASGFSTALTNIGEVENRGWELELYTQNLNGDFNWSTSINLSYNTNEVKKLGPDNAPILGGDFDIEHNILQVGQPMYSYYVVQQDGILTQADIENGAALFGNQTAGDPRYVDANGDGVIDQNDRVLSGHPNPDYIWGITNTFRYKGFDLSVLLQGQWGGHLYSTFGRAIDRTGMGYNQNVLGKYRDRWRSAEDPGNGVVGKSNSNFGGIKNTDWLYSSDYWRVRNITLGYNFGEALKDTFFKSIRVYIALENFFGGDKYAGGWNPEARNTSGDDYGGAPLSKSFITGINVTF
ncbi:TonB-linked outer membrane protein, SusC/RagA family [Sinomicrobium oceani]|uniref:TonB-linked outer membrane protein, SusC/RagA family n=1 Tax=Sinomicrobium oceani TaxID=1150368 RepID=A0A1K1RI77_9FLAO|nr:TonB-dependent receptor [Sinomicrobium oceani]SFW71499.1 TonB-linked outer membrane protein, SusC/RagA family [Sinomicrobium oceani]